MRHTENPARPLPLSEVYRLTEAIERPLSQDIIYPIVALSGTGFQTTSDHPFYRSVS